MYYIRLADILKDKMIRQHTEQALTRKGLKLVVKREVKGRTSIKYTSDGQLIMLLPKLKDILADSKQNGYGADYTFGIKVLIDYAEALSNDK